MSNMRRIAPKVALTVLPVSLDSMGSPVIIPARVSSHWALAVRHCGLTICHAVLAALLLGMFQAMTASASEDLYTLGTGDELKITVYGEASLSGQFVVDQAGMISIPLIGDVKAAGLTLHEMKNTVRESLLDGYLKHPLLSVEVISYRPYIIDGEVVSPGQYPFQQGVTIRQAITVAGGFKYAIYKHEAIITRRGDPEEKAFKASLDALVHPGDYIWILE